jgi:hypothetical protein
MNDAQRGLSAEAFQAYNAMETTKRRHFEFLTMLDKAAKKWNLAPSEAQEIMREALLADHDRQVQAFKAHSAELRRQDAGAFDALWAYIGRINDAFQPLHEQQGH